MNSNKLGMRNATLYTYIRIYDDDCEDLLLIDGCIDVKVELFDDSISTEIGTLEQYGYNFCDYNKVINNVLEYPEINLIESKTQQIRDLIYEALQEVEFDCDGDSEINIEINVDEL